MLKHREHVALVGVIDADGLSEKKRTGLKRYIDREPKGILLCPTRKRREDPGCCERRQRWKYHPWGDPSKLSPLCLELVGPPSAMKQMREFKFFEQIDLMTIINFRTHGQNSWT